VRDIPILLQDHFDGRVHTVCYLLKVMPVGNNAPAVFGVTSLDNNITFDDGDGPLTYYAMAGMVPSTLKASSSLGVDNGQAETLIGAFAVESFVEELVTAGRYNNANFQLLVVNYKDLAAGAMEEMFGTLGRVRVIEGLVCFPELRGITASARQNPCKRDSITCRRDFGDEICGVDLGPLWQTSAVSAVGTENDRVFTVTGITPPAHGFKYGMAEWIDGDNVARSYEIEDWEDLGGGAVRVYLAHTTHYLIGLGDAVKIRPGCGKLFREHCIAIWNNGLQFDGEPDIPVGDEASLQTPGASAETPAGNGAGNVEDETEEA
jgi:uncharacterized phage protein (TIGR02218 family)